jgi:hypothetical protein
MEGGALILIRVRGLRGKVGSRYRDNKPVEADI